MPTIVVGQVTVPDLIGQNTVDAEAMLTATYLTMRLIQRPIIGTAAGIITAQSPVANADVEPNTEVAVLASNGVTEIRNFTTTSLTPRDFRRRLAR